MSFRQEILNEIKNLLNEADDPEIVLNRLMGYIGKLTVDQMPHALAPETAKEFLAAAKDVVAARTYAAASTGIVGAYKNNRNGALKLKTICKLGNVGGKYDFLMTRDGQKVQWCNEQTEVSATPKPPEPKPGLRGPGCKPGSSFIGLNGVTSGEGVVSVQSVFTMIYPADAKFDRRGFTYNGKTDERGTFGVATEEAVLDFQKTKGGKYAAKIQNELGSSLGNPDGCVGPKTGCALVIASDGRAVAGYNMAKCKAKFGAKKIAQKKLASAEPAESTPTVAESKTWAVETKEKASASLFERLVKDVSNKKVI